MLRLIATFHMPRRGREITLVEYLLSRQNGPRRKILSSHFTDADHGLAWPVAAELGSQRGVLTP